MSVNKKNRSLWGSRSEAQRIYYQRQTIKRLEKENNQLKEQRQELRSWLENKLTSDNYTDGVYYGFKSCLLKLNKLEGDKND